MAVISAAAFFLFVNAHAHATIESKSNCFTPAFDK